MTTDADRNVPIYPAIDQVRPASEMGLAPAQIAWLTDIARPRCCHVTGEHDPKHFSDSRYVCSYQLAEIAWRLRSALEIDDEPVDRGWYLQRRVDPATAIPRAGCPQCEEAGR